MPVKLENISSIAPNGAGQIDVPSDVNLTGTPAPVYRINGTPLSLGQNQTPWLSNINGAGYQLGNVNAVGLGMSPPAWGANSSFLFIQNRDIGIRFSNTQPDYLTKILCGIQVDDLANTQGDKRMVDILVSTLGSTPGNRGGRLDIGVRSDGGSTTSLIASITSMGMSIRTGAVPAYPLDVDGDAGISGNISTGGIAIGTWPLPANRRVVVQTNGVNQSVQITDTSSTANPGVVVTNDIGRGAVFGMGGSAAPAPRQNTAYVGGGTATDLSLEAGGEKVRITTAGSVGIGTATPVYRLDVVGDVNTTGAYRINGVPLNLGQNQTPWLSNIDGGNYALTNVSRVQIGGQPYVYKPLGVTGPGGLPSLPAILTGAFILADSEFVSSGFVAGAYGLAAPGGAWLQAFMGAGNDTAGRLTLNPLGGNVGVGTDTPGAPLEVRGTARFGPAIAPLDVGTSTDSGSSVAVNSTALALSLQTSDTTRIFIGLTGNVGIGTASPAAQLHIVGYGQYGTVYDPTTPGGSGGTLNLQDTGGSAGNGGAVTFQAIYGAPFAAIKGSVNSGADYSAGALCFFTRTASVNSWLNEVMRIDSNYVGIRTTTPSDPLTIGGMGTGGQLRIVQANYGVIFRNDGATLYLMTTNAGDPYGMWKTPWPLQIDLATSYVGIQGAPNAALTVFGDVNITGQYMIYGVPISFSALEARLAALESRMA